MFYAAKGKFYVYIFVTAVKTYIGTKKGDNTFYGSSSQDVAFKRLIETGEAKVYVVWEGHSEATAAAIETYLVSFAKDNFVTVANRNSGGGFGEVDISRATEKNTLAGRNIILGKYPEDKVNFSAAKNIAEKIEQYAQWQKTAVKDMLDGRDNPFIQYLVKKNVAIAIAAPAMQPRDFDLDKKHKDIIANRMQMETHDEWVRKTRPISFIGGKRWNGAHTLSATETVNIEPEIWCLDLPAELFDNSLVQMELYATACNMAEDVTSMSVDPKKEIRLRLDGFYVENSDLFEEDESAFIDLFATYYSKRFTPKQIAANFTAWKNVRDESSARGTNFIDYMDFRGVKLIDLINKKVQRLFGTEGVSNIPVSTLNVSGFANPFNYLYVVNEFETTEVVLSYHSNTSSENTYTQQRSKLHKIYTACDWKIDESQKKFGVVPYTKGDKKVYIVELPARIDNQEAGSGSEWASKIIEMVFDID